MVVFINEPMHMMVDFLGIRSHYHCAVFADSITSKIHDYVQHYENFINQVIICGF